MFMRSCNAGDGCDPVARNFANWWGAKTVNRDGVTGSITTTHWWNRFWSVQVKQTNKKSEIALLITRSICLRTFIASTLAHVGTCVLSERSAYWICLRNTTSHSRCALFNSAGRNDLLALPQVVYRAAGELKWKHDGQKSWVCYKAWWKIHGKVD